jgi:hypothetical protein
MGKPSDHRCSEIKGQAETKNNMKFTLSTAKKA